MHGVQPRPNSTPSSGAPASPSAGRQCSRHSRCSRGTQPRKARPSTIVSTPSDPLSASLVLEQERAEPAEQHAGADEHDGEPGDEQQRAGEQPARAVPARPGRPPVSPVDVGQVAGHQRQHARRQERHQPGERRDRQGQQQRAVGDGACARRAHLRAVSASDVVDEPAQGRRRRPRRARGRRPGPARSSTSVVGIALRRQRAASASSDPAAVGRRGSGR